MDFIMLGYRIKKEEKGNHRAENYFVLCKEIIKRLVYRERRWYYDLQRIFNRL